MWKDLTTWAHRHKLLVALALVLGGYLLFRQVEMRIQKAEFKRAESYVASEASRATKTVKPEQNSTNNSCTYRSKKYGRGDRSCQVSQVLKYRVINYNNANEVMRMVANNYDSPVYNQSGSSLKISAGMSSTFSQKLYGSKLDCSVDYKYAPKSPASAENYLTITFSCYKNSFAEYYPVTY